MAIFSITDLKERIRFSDDFTQEEKQFLLWCVNLGVMSPSSRKERPDEAKSNAVSPEKPEAD